MNSEGVSWNIPAVGQIMAWRRPGDKPLSEPMMVIFVTHICVTRPQWVNQGSGGSGAVGLFICCLYHGHPWCDDKKHKLALLNTPDRHYCIWVWSRRRGCLVTWFCYQLIAKPGNKTTVPLWPDPYDGLMSNSAPSHLLDFSKTLYNTGNNNFATFWFFR